MKVHFFKHSLGKEEKKAISESIDLGFLTTGIKVKEFEEYLSDYTGISYATGLMSCTAALHLGLLACGIGPGDEVITTPLTFAATSLAIVHTGAKPVWVDVHKDTGLIDERKIEQAITIRTKAILPVHLYGMPCNMEKIREITNKRETKQGVPTYVIEDAAHALEVQNLGKHSDGVCFSFYATKSITCGEGGAFCTDSAAINEKVRMLRTHGMTTDASDRFNRKYEHYDITEFGWKYNMSNIQASVLIPQLRKANKNLEKRREIYKKYVERLSGIKNVDLLKCDPEVSGLHLFTVLVPAGKRDLVINGLQASDIGVTVNYRPTHLLKAFYDKFGKGPGSFPIAEGIGNRTISLPFHVKLTDDELDFVCERLRCILTSI